MTVPDVPSYVGEDLLLEKYLCTSKLVASVARCSPAVLGVDPFDIALSLREYYKLFCS